MEGSAVGLLAFPQGGVETQLFHCPFDSLVLFCFFGPIQSVTQLLNPI